MTDIGHLCDRQTNVNHGIFQLLDKPCLIHVSIIFGHYAFEIRDAIGQSLVFFICHNYNNLKVSCHKDRQIN
jgi:hypothetical protein